MPQCFADLARYDFQDGKLKKYNSANEILQDFFDIRLEFYEKRKQYLTSKLQEDVGRLQNKYEEVLYC